MIPQLISASEEIQLNPGKKKPPRAFQSKTSGSISALIEKTSLNEIKPKKYAYKITEGNDIFSKSGFQKLKNRRVNIPDKLIGSKDPLNIKIVEETNRNIR